MERLGSQGNGTRGFGKRRHLPLLGAAIGVLALLTAACSEESQTDFTDDNETGFLAACSAPLEDAPLIGDICECVFEQALDDFPFDEFTEMDEALKADPTQELQTEINQLIANCVISEADL